MVQKGVGRVAALAAGAAREFARLRGVRRQLVEPLCQAPFQGQQVRDVGRCTHIGGGLRDQGGELVHGHGKHAFTGAGVGAPVLQQAAQARRLQGFGCGQAQGIVKPEARPVLQVFGGPVFALRCKPGHFLLAFVGAEQRRAAPAAKTHHDARLGQFAHGCLRHRGAGAQQHGGGVGNGNVPVQGTLALVGHIFDPAPADQHAAVLQVIDVGALGMQDGLKVRRAYFLHGMLSGAWPVLFGRGKAQQPPLSAAGVHRSQMQGLVNHPIGAFYSCETPAPEALFSVWPEWAFQCFGRRCCALCMAAYAPALFGKALQCSQGWCVAGQPSAAALPASALSYINSHPRAAPVLMSFA